MDSQNKNVVCNRNHLPPSSEKLALLGSLPFALCYQSVIRASEDFKIN